MLKRTLPAGDNAKKNSRLLRTFGEGGFRVLKSLYGVLRHPKEKGQALGRLSVFDAAVPAGALPFDKKEWRGRFRRLLLTTNDARAMTLAESFYADAVVPKRFACGAPVDGFDAVRKEIAAHDARCPVVLFAVKNDLVRVKQLLPHYRALGAERFAAIDNGSDDGTLEYLLEQPDTDVYTTAAKFGSVQKAGWLDRLAAFYGTERWYLWIDADEFFAYPGDEAHPLRELAAALERKGVYRMRTFLLDMYPDCPLLSIERKSGEFLSECVFFDPDGDDYVLEPEIMRLSGGMRKRVFGLEGGTLSKVTLLHFGGGRMLTGAHNIFPQAADYSGAFNGVLKHYKFLPDDLNKYRRIVEAGTYTNGSAEYKRYLKVYSEHPDLIAFGAFSRRYTGSADLKEAFPQIENPFAE